jgi:hypothetical protein
VEDDNTKDDSDTLDSRVIFKRRASMGKWTEDKADLLRSAVGDFGGKSWKKIASRLLERTDVQCLHQNEKRAHHKKTGPPFITWQESSQCVTESSPSAQTCRLSVVRDVQRSVVSRSRHNSTGTQYRYCPAQTTPNLPIRSHPVKEHPRHNFFLVGILRVSSVQAQNSTVSSFRIFTTAHGLPKLTQPVFSVNARGFFPLLLSTLPSRYRVETFRTPAESTPTGRSTTTPDWNCGDPTVFQLRVHQNHQTPPLSPTSTRNLPLPSRVRSNNPSDNWYQLKPRRLDCFSVQHPPKHRHCPRTRVHQTSESIESTN